MAPHSEETTSARDSGLGQLGSVKSPRPNICLDDEASEHRLDSLDLCTVVTVACWTLWQEADRLVAPGFKQFDKLDAAPRLRQYPAWPLQFEPNSRVSVQELQTECRLFAASCILSWRDADQKQGELAPASASRESGAHQHILRVSRFVGRSRFVASTSYRVSLQRGCAEFLRA